MTTKPVAKSLHTVTVLVQVTRNLIECAGFEDVPEALDIAMSILNLADRPDPYGLAAAALKQMGQGK